MTPREVLHWSLLLIPGIATGVIWLANRRENGIGFVGLVFLMYAAGFLIATLLRMKVGQNPALWTAIGLTWIGGPVGFATAAGLGPLSLTGLVAGVGATIAALSFPMPREP